RHQVSAAEQPPADTGRGRAVPALPAAPARPAAAAADRRARADRGRLVPGPAYHAGGGAGDRAPHRRLQGHRHLPSERGDPLRAGRCADGGPARRPRLRREEAGVSAVGRGGTWTDERSEEGRWRTEAPRGANRWALV